MNSLNIKSNSGVPGIQEEASKFIKICGQTPIPANEQLTLINKVYNMALAKYKHFELTLLTIYNLGRIHGIQAERRRRKKAGVSA